jgi:glycosyltransferase involved in cell wall biosynthesis
VKILYCLPHPAHRLDSSEAGHIVRANALLAALREAGHDVLVLQAAEGAATRAAVGAHRDLVKRVLPRPLSPFFKDIPRLLLSRRFAAQVTATVRAERPDCILETHVAQTVAGVTASAATGCPLVVDDVAPWWEEEVAYGVRFRALTRRVYDQVTAGARLLVAVSSEIRRSLVDIGVPADKIVLVPNAVDARVFAAERDAAAVRRRLGIAADAVVVVFAGSFQDYQRVDRLLAAFAELAPARPVHLLLVGDGRNRPAAAALVRELGLADRVTFTGHVPYDAVADYTAAGDIAVVPATNDYGNPMKLYDYSALGKAVVAPDQSTVTDIVTHGESAWLFAKDDGAALTAALARLVDDAALRARLGGRAALLARERTWQRRGQDLARALQAVAAPAAAARPAATVDTAA